MKPLKYDLRLKRQRLESIYSDIAVKFTLEFDSAGNPYFMCRPKDDLFLDKLYDLKYLRPHETANK